MYKYFEQNDLFFTSQYGFRTDHSTELAALEVVIELFVTWTETRSLSIYTLNSPKRSTQ